jgi:superfamily I DNA and/or RNA helicase
LKKYSSKKDGYKPPTIGVIAPYRSQVANLSKTIDRMDANGTERPIVSTVDQFQGRDQV